MDRGELRRTVAPAPGAGSAPAPAPAAGTQRAGAEAAGRMLGRSARALALITFLVLALGSCRLLGGDSGPLEVTATGSSVTLGWDAPPAPPIPNSPQAVTHYAVYYRPYGTHGWYELGETEGPETSYTISQDELDPGDYEFAVRSVRTDGERSAMHSSGDFDAHPTGGWYLNWEPAAGSEE